MKYEIVKLNKKIVAGIGAITSNQDPDMTMIIGSLWNRFYRDGIYERIPYKTHQKPLGIYTDYTSEEKGDYFAMVACEVKQSDGLPEELTVREFPAGVYARFVVKGDLHKAVGEFWSRLWEMDLKRTFIYDFEEYQNSDEKDAEIHVYIGVENGSK